MNETTIVNHIRAEIKRRGGKVYKLHGSQFSQAGAPDLIGTLDKVPFAIEVKQAGKMPTPLQQHELEEWRKQGWATGCAHDVAEAIEIIAVAWGCGVETT